MWRQSHKADHTPSEKLTEEGGKNYGEVRDSDHEFDGKFGEDHNVMHINGRGREELNKRLFMRSPVSDSMMPFWTFCNIDVEAQ